MPGLLPAVDPDGLLEYSVVFTDRSLNHRSRAFQQVMRELSATLMSVSRPTLSPLCPVAVRSRWRRWRGSLPVARAVWWCAMAGSATAGHRFSRWAASLPVLTR